jgi:hypothetical protein
MSNTEDVRWIQRFSNYNRVLDKFNNIFQKIIHQYQALFNRFRITMEEKRAGSQLDLF